jgi:hypothetical protein
VDNLLGPDLMGAKTNARIADDNQNVYRTVGAGSRACGRSIRAGTSWSPASYQRGDTMGTWETDPFLGDNKSRAFFDEWRNDEWYTTAAHIKGDLGFAELSVTASLLQSPHRLRMGQHELRAVAHVQLTPDYDPAVYPGYFLYDTGYNHETTPNFQKQNRWAYEARLTSQGDSKLQWMAGAFYEDVYDWWQYGAS